ncbi:polyadenylate-binding protein-interacting protein 6 [Arachis stenosperma]|uniref:polyadenylate-binding protein-interacting protein 6 n=1 Tax=Arachis stenosperma TaxID=217475 RepID=UPI0025AD49E0|nr:polyadenylate-binding protein-interacting protein 6 [Arachis stenosperma]
MKQIVSSLNPYAASYVPLSKRESHGATADPFQSPPYHAAQNQHHQFHSSASASKPVAETFQGNINNPASSSYGSVPTGFVDNQFADYDPDMDVEYLRMQFPGISEESLRDVYMVNECDIDAAVEMLNQLELKFDGVESSGNLPETLDIGDVSESGSASDSASLKLKNVAAEASTSTSSSHLSANTL